MISRATPICRHCQDRLAFEERISSTDERRPNPRLLCHICYRDKEIRAMYPLPKKSLADRYKKYGPLCRRCERLKTQPGKKGLCCQCYKTHGRKYASAYQALRGIDGLGNTEDPPLPKKPTSAKPGTEEKILVMRARYEAEEAIFHPHDRGLS